MTGVPKHTIYPQYCFHLSPTINRWCPLRASQVHELRGHAGFEGQDVYFYLNHPVKWVRVVGLVVAIDEWSGCRVYTIDDSSRATIECVINIPKHATSSTTLQTSRKEDAAAAEGKATVAAARAKAKEGEEEKRPVVDREIDVGDVLDVRGSIIRFRDTKKIKVTKVLHLRSTAEEVQFWDKLAQFHDDVLARPWELTDREVRRCRKDAEGVEDLGRSKRHRGDDSKRRDRHDTATGLERGRKAGMVHAAVTSREERTQAIVTGLERTRNDLKVSSMAPDIATGLESKRKAVKVHRAVTSQEDRDKATETFATGLERSRKFREVSSVAPDPAVIDERLDIATGLERRSKGSRQHGGYTTPDLEAPQKRGESNGSLAAANRKVHEVTGTLPVPEHVRMAREIGHTTTTTTATGLESKRKTNVVDITLTGLGSKRRIREVTSIATGLESKRRICTNNVSTGSETQRKVHESLHIPTGLESSRKAREIRTAAMVASSQGATRMMSQGLDEGSSLATGLERKVKRPKPVAMEGSSTMSLATGLERRVKRSKPVNIEG